MSGGVDVSRQVEDLWVLCQALRLYETDNNLVQNVITRLRVMAEQNLANLLRQYGCSHTLYAETTRLLPIPKSQISGLTMRTCLICGERWRKMPEDAEWTPIEEPEKEGTFI